MSVAHRRLHYVERCPPPAARAHAQEEGREGGWGGGGSRDANAMFDLCQMHLCQYTCQNAQLFSQTLLVNINEGQALSKWIVTIPSLANSWKPLKTFASAAKTPGPAPAIVGVLGTAPHISLKQL